MKFKTYKILCCLILSLVFSACHDNEVQPKHEINKTDLESIMSFQEEIGFIQNAIVNSITSVDNSGGRNSIKKSITQQIKDYLPCADPSESDSDTLHITINFGDGCLREDGALLFGKMELTTILSGDSLIFSTKYFDYHEVNSDESESPTVNGECNGTFIMTPAFMLLLKYFHEDLNLKYKDDSNASFSLVQRIEAVENGVRFTELTSKGALPNGDKFHTEVIKPLIISFSCGDDVEYPVEGTQSLTLNSSVAKIDYGNGTCDNEYKIINE